MERNWGKKVIKDKTREVDQIFKEYLQEKEGALERLWILVEKDLRKLALLILYQGARGRVPSLCTSRICL